MKWNKSVSNIENDTIFVFHVIFGAKYDFLMSFMILLMVTHRAFYDFSLLF